jgi:hypothetical protein
MSARPLLAVALLSLACQKQPASPPERAPATPAPGPIEEAQSLLDQGQLDAALARLAQAPEGAEALYLQGRVWAKKAESAPLPTPPPLSSPLPRGAVAPAAPEFKPEELQALECFEKSAAARPGYAPAHLALAELLSPHALQRVEQERQAAAAQARKRGGRRGKPPEPAPLPPPSGPDASVDRVIRAYREAVQADPASKVAVEALTQFAVRAGRVDEADAGFLELLRRDRENPDPLIRYGDFLVQTKKDPQGAVAQYSQALMWRTDDEATRAKIADIYLVMAGEHLTRNEYASAEARLKDAQKYVADTNSPQGLKVQDLAAQISQIRRPAIK